MYVNASWKEAYAQQLLLFCIFSGNKYVLVFTDYFTKWVEAEGIPEKSAECVANVFVKFICAHGCPKILITDQGREFCNSLNDRICRDMNIDHKIASAYHPQTGGHTERFNRTLCSMLGHYVNAGQNDWDRKLPFVLFAYRTAQHESTKQTPFYLVYGRVARLPVELDIPTAQSTECKDHEATLKRRCDSFQQLLFQKEQASLNIKVAQRKQKKNHDATIDVHVFKTGDKVLLHNTRLTTRKGGKLQPKWKGPYTINKVNAKGTYCLEGMKSAVNGSRLTMYKSEHEINDVSNSALTEDVANEKELTYDVDKKTDDVDKETYIASKHYQTEYRNQTENDTVQTQEQTDCPAPLPLKKRKIENLDIHAVDESPGSKTLHFNPVDKDWQQNVSNLFHEQMKNTNETGHDRYISINAKPSKTVTMRGDGNCLFRTFSYVVFGVQNFHNIVRQTLTSFMKENDNIMRQVTCEPINQYLQSSNMEAKDTWGTEVEIFAFASFTNTSVYVYCMYGREEKWLEYKPLSNDPTSRKAVFIQNTNDHFVPVLDVEGEEYSRPPYVCIKNYVPEKFHKYLSEDMLTAALVNNYRDEQLLQEREKSIETIYVKEFTNVRYAIDRINNLIPDVDPNIFNLICDWGYVENLLN